MAQKSPTHWLPELLKDKFVKISFKVILSLAVLLLMYIVGKAIFGYPVKILGFEVNSPTPKRDTVYKNNEIRTIEDTPKQKTVETKTSTPFVIKKYIPEPEKKKPKPDTVIKNQTINSGNNNRSVTGDNNQVVNGDINITNDRKLSS